VTFDPGCRLTPCKNVHARRFDHEIVILDLEQGLYFQLDEVGAAIWEGFVGGQSLDEIARALAARYDAPTDRILADARALAERLEAAGLVERR
jgi:hypothetical protein